MTAADPQVLTQPEFPGAKAQRRAALARRLVWLTTASVAVVAVVLSVANAVVSFQTLQQELDRRLVAADSAFGINPMAVHPVWDAMFYADRVERHGELEYAIHQVPDGVSLTGVSNLLDENAPPGQTIRTVRFERGGDYRVLTSVDSGRYAVVGQPLSEVTDLVARQLILAGVLSLVAVGVTFLLVRRLIAGALAPVSRRAASATAIARLPME